MFQLNTVGRAGRQHRFKYGPFAVVRTVHPVTGEFLQLPSLAADRNLRQYLYSARVRLVRADHQLPCWLARYVSGRSLHTAQLVDIDDGGQLICLVRKNVAAGCDGRVDQLHKHLWRVQRSWGNVDAERALNTGLELLSQAVKGTFSDRFADETEVVVAALRRSRTCSAGELATYLTIHHPVREGVRETIVSRLMLAGRLGADLRHTGWGEDTVLHWDCPGSGYLPPLPTFYEAQEAS